MKIPIPLYRLEAILRHYSTLSEAYGNGRSIKADDAWRLSRKEIAWLKKEIDLNNTANEHQPPVQRT